MKNKTKTYKIITFGCQMNYSDSERFRTVLHNIGYVENNHIKLIPDIIVLNTCSVRESAEQRITGLGNKFEKFKRKNPKLKIILTGCMARKRWNDDLKKATKTQIPQQKLRNYLKKRFKWLDFIIETKDFYKLKDIIKENSDIDFDLNHEIKIKNYLDVIPFSNNSFQGLIPISTGCNNFCSYCIVPFSRGREKRRKLIDILTDVLFMLLQGKKEIVLLGQTVNSWVNEHEDFDLISINKKAENINHNYLSSFDLSKWAEILNTIIKKYKKKSSYHSEIKAELYSQKHDFPKVKDFLQLLQVIDVIKGEWWLSWMSSYPNYMSKKLIDFIAESSEKGHHRKGIHFALQSGSDQILRKMNRKYMYKDFLDIVNYIYKKVPNVCLSTDIITGFPGETQKDYEKTIQALKECKFEMVYISAYSPRPGTAAFFLNDDIPLKIKNQQKKFLNDEILAKIALKSNKALIGTIQKILIDSVDKKTNQLIGRNSQNKIIRVINLYDQSKIGEFIDVKVVSCTAWALQGRLIKNK